MGEIYSTPKQERVPLAHDVHNGHRYPNISWIVQLDADSFESMLKLHPRHVQQEAQVSTSIEELNKKYKKNMGIKIESEATSQQILESQREEYENEMKITAQGTLLNNIETLNEEGK
ncbi:unnamed protein product [Citrullus colocynthis]|uniref:Uncharacterized protein n=1 Tax=Citrullus colocynthis TaxID=252529 RepID=A0ABP0XLX0_9ROSI